MTKVKFQTVTGMHDIYGEDQKYYEKIEKELKKISEFYHFKKITTPILEEADLFIRSVGEETDIVEKEMYVLKTKGRDILVLRPEGTAPIVRSYIEHGMVSQPQPIKFWYYGPYFRYEKPQAGRYRQFWQAGFEVLGDSSSVYDAQIIAIAYNLLGEIGLKKLIVNVNSIGCDECRKEYKKALLSFLRKQKDALCANCKKRTQKNVLRVLDCKDDKCRQVLEDAPQILDFICEDCKKHFKQVLEYLEELNIPYRLDPFLVRGLDYYSRTVFEIGFCEGDDSLGSLVGGGRYDDLSSQLKSSDIPAVGFAMGVERVIAAMQIKGIKPEDNKPERIFIIQVGDLARKRALGIIEEFRRAKIDIAESISKDSMKAQLTKANKLGIKIVLILGQKEALEKNIIIKNMETGRQSVVSQENIVKEVKKAIK